MRLCHIEIMSPRDGGTPRKPVGPAGVLASAQAALVDLGDLTVAQFRLVRVELTAELRRTGSRVAVVATCVPVLALGWGLIVAAGAGWLSTWMGLPGALLVLGLFHLIVGTLGLLIGLRRLARSRPLDRATRGVTETVDRVRQAMAR